MRIEEHSESSSHESVAIFAKSQQLITNRRRLLIVSQAQPVFYTVH
jgi:hypothetical protein